MSKKITILEAFGIAATAPGALYMRNLYQICGGGLAGIMFGAVNQSIWEQCKTLLLPYFLWAAIEVMSLGLSFHRFVPAKTCGLYLLGLLYIGLRLVNLPELFCAAVSVCAGFGLSFSLYRSELKLQNLFAPSVTLLFLFFSLYFSLTAFAPEHRIFLDPQSGTYGIIPFGYDYGAVALSGEG